MKTQKFFTFNYLTNTACDSNKHSVQSPNSKHVMARLSRMWAFISHCHRMQSAQYKRVNCEDKSFPIMAFLQIPDKNRKKNALFWDTNALLCCVLQ